MNPTQPVLDRGSFLNSAVLVQGSLILLSMLLTWGTGINPMKVLDLSWAAFFFGIAATLPMLLLCFFTYRSRQRGLRRIREFLVGTIGPILVQCCWYDLIMLALLAGLSEEILFRGILQPWLFDQLVEFRWFPQPEWLSIGLVNLIFGMAHLVTPMYGVLAWFIGCYLSFVQQFSPNQNLLSPIVTHAFYDWIMFYVIIRSTKNLPGREPDQPSDGDADL